MRQNFQCPPIDDLGLRGLAWVFVGIVYGFIFAVTAEVTRAWLGQPLSLLLATLAGATLTALVYGSMRLVVVIGNVAFVVTLLLLLFGRGSSWFDQVMLVFLPAVLGLVIGAAYGWRDRGSRVCCADAKIIAGLFAGAVTLIPAGLFIVLFGSDDAVVYPWLVMLVAPLAGALYVNTACWFVHRLHALLPPAGDGAVVGLGVGAVTGLLFVVIGAAFEPDVAAQGGPMAFVAGIHEVVGSALLGAAVGCLVLGLIRAFMRSEWYRL